jgi:hypothetical protein
MQIIFIHDSKFVCDFVESLCKSNDLGCFSINDTSDFTYLVDDLKPALVIIDKSAYLEDEDRFLSGISAASHQTKTMIVGMESEKFDYANPGMIVAETFAKDIKFNLK